MRAEENTENIRNRRLHSQRVVSHYKHLERVLLWSSLNIAVCTMVSYYSQNTINTTTAHGYGYWLSRGRT